MVDVGKARGVGSPRETTLQTYPSPVVPLVDTGTISSNDLLLAALKGGFAAWM